MGRLFKLRQNVNDMRRMNALFPARHVASAFGRASVRLSIRRAGGDIEFRPATSDADVLRQVFVDESYDISVFPQYERIMAYYRRLLSDDQVPVIVDAGANIGASSIWFANTFPEAVVVAVEPDRANNELCRRNTARLDKVKVVEAAIGSSPGRAEITNPHSAPWEFQTKRSDGGPIPIVSVAELLASVPNGRPFAAKIDIEGFESELFSSDTEWVRDFSLLIVEPHDWMLPEAKTSRALQKVIAEHDFDILISGENLIYVNSRL